MKKFLVAFCAAIASASFAGTYYVDAESGNDAYDGSSETFVSGKVGPMKTLAAILGVATNKGDVVIAAPGTYKDGTMTYTDSGKLRGLCRAVVADDVTLQSRDGAEKTIILGQDATSPVSDCGGCGTDSVRGVLLDVRAKLIGFTVTGGRAYCSSKSDYALGGGVACRNYQNWNNPDPVVSDCIMTNNAAVDGGGGYCGVWVRTRIVGNRSYGTANGTSSALRGENAVIVLQDCYVNDNKGTANKPTQVNEGSYCYNTTFGPDGDKTALWVISGHQSTSKNCVFLGDIGGSGNSSYFKTSRCAFLSTVTVGGSTPEAYIAAYGDKDDLVLDANEMNVGADGRLGAGSALVDIGSNKYHVVSSRAPAGGDLYGTTRILGPAIDLGCCEYDFKVDPLDALGYVKITAASDAVYSAGEGSFDLVNGTEATVLVRHAPLSETRTVFSAEVTSAGTLAIYRNSEAEPWQTLTAAGGKTTLSLTSTDDVTLRFVLSGGDADSRAVLSDFSNCAYACISADQGKVVVTGANVGTNFVTVGGSLSFTIRRVLSYGVVVTGVTVNGVFHSFEDEAPDGMTLSFTVTDANRSSSLEIVTVYETPETYAWYVDAQNGKDTNSGLSRFDSFKTLHHAMTNALLQSGETVWALPGTYDTDPMGTTTGSGLSRVIVQKGVTLRSTEGAEKTVIMGAKATEPLQLDGCGVDSVRCAYLMPKSKLIGFTLTGGYARFATTSDKGEGGGFYMEIDWGAGNQNYLQNCIVSNNVAYTYGGGHAGCGYVVGCRIVGNKAQSTSSGAGQRNATFIDTYFNGNTGCQQVYWPGTCVNVTFGPDGHSSNLAVDPYTSGARYRNCVFLGGVANISSHANFFCDNCVFADTVTGAQDYVDDAASPQTNCRVLSAEDLQVTDGVPAKTSELVGAADTSLYATYAAAYSTGLDANGVPRFLNGSALDVGGFEHDWRKDYAADLTKRAVVTDVSPAVVETADNKVRLIDGTILEAKIAYKAGAQARVPFSFAISGAGTLTITVDGVIAGTFTAGDTELAWRTKKAVETVVFSYEGDGYADIGKVSDALGFMMIVR